MKIFEKNAVSDSGVQKRPVILRRCAFIVLAMLMKY